VQSPEVSGAKRVMADDHNSFILNGRRVEIRDVWADNLEAEMAIIRDVVQRYPYVAMVSGAWEVACVLVGARAWARAAPRRLFTV
jgi:hypothetical protein